MLEEIKGTQVRRFTQNGEYGQIDFWVKSQGKEILEIKTDLINGAISKEEMIFFQERIKKAIQKHA